MARIRTVKPEFFRSPDTLKVGFPVRLFYQALWCWADDFGVGETNINGLLGFAFGDDDGFTAQDVRGFCADVAQAFGVVFYEVRGRRYYSIPSWEKHQKVEKRSERRKHPGPDDPDAITDLRISNGAESAPKVPRENGADSALEQGTGNIGTGEQEDIRPPQAPDPFDEFWSVYPRRDAKRKAEQAYRAATKRTSPVVILAGAKRYRDDPNRTEQFTAMPATWLNGDRWDDGPLPPRNGARDRPSGRPTTDDRVRDGLELARRLAEREQQSDRKEITA